MKRSFTALLFTLFSIGCASTGAPEPEPAADLAGVYTLSTTVQGMALSGRMRITGEPGAYDGAIYTDFTGEIPFSSVTVSGDRATILGETPDGPVELHLVFDGDTFTGSWVMGPEGGSIRGRRVER